MTSYTAVLRRLEALGLLVERMDQSYARGAELDDFSPEWTGHVVLPGSASALLSAYHTLSTFAGAPLRRWSFVSYPGGVARFVDAFVEAGDQPPPPWLAAWPEDPSSP